MGERLVIVESAAKAKTIEKYLGSTYKVIASLGHVRDLPKSQLGIDIENNFEPKYITIRGKGEIIEKLKKASKKSEKIYLATDPDREGEAISWHLNNILKVDEDKIFRIEFNEITKTAVKNAIKNPRKVNMNLVDAQQARRVLDRLVGYEIGPILWKKVKWGLSAGRVQSVAMRIICDREEEIKNFVPKEFWTIEVAVKGYPNFILKLALCNGEKIEILNEEEANKIIDELKKGKFIVKSIKNTKRTKNPLPPFITSTLQQDAYKRLNYTTKKTMNIAQRLYEGVTIEGYGTIGLITYMRTDSTRIANEAQNSCRDFIALNYGKEYVPEAKRVYKSKKNSQDAHEAIRPSDVLLTPDKAKGSLTDEQYKLYKLIWERFVASQMASCEYDVKTIEVENGKYILKSSGSKITFDGFMKLYSYTFDNEDESFNIPSVKEKEELKYNTIDGKQHFTQAPPRFTEGSLVKFLEENGIGRPSTYAPIISTLLARKYVEKEKKLFIPTELGIIVNRIMETYFKSIVDIDFTADMENKLDLIENGNSDWKKIIKDFFSPFKENVDIAEKEVSKITIEDEVSDVPCDKCGRMMVIKRGRFGEFLACPNYPECKNTKPIVKKLNNVKCPKCGGDIQIRRSKKGRTFYGCSNYPNCDFVSWYEPVDETCNICGSIMVKKTSKTKGTYTVCSNAQCPSKEKSKVKNKSI
ncbi:MAG: type I DNA topoisomerase [Oscillospiraceae bacterium]|nr:type I DNA topoisomerase [Oscillospiraceae bacterium]